MDQAGRYTDPRTLSREVWKARTVSEYDWSDDRRLLVGAGLSEVSGPTTIGIGIVDVTLASRTLRTAYEDQDLQARLYWSWMSLETAFSGWGESPTVSTFKAEHRRVDLLVAALGAGAGF